MRQRFIRLLLLLIPITLLVGEHSLVKVKGLPIYWFEAATVLFALLTWPELKKGGLDRLRNVPLVVRWGAALMVPALAISVAVAQVHSEALGAAKAWFIMPMILAVLIVASGVEAEPLIFGIVIAALIQTAYGIQILPTQEVARVTGTYSSANFYAATVVPAIFLSLMLPTKAKWLVIAVLLWGLILSQSLGGFLGLIGGGVYLVFVLVKDRRTRIIMGVVTMLIAVLGVGLARERFLNNPKSSLASREQIWQVAWKIGKEHPVTGIGLRNFDNVYLTTVTSVIPNPIEWNVPEPHNLYLAFWLDLSLVGLVAILLIIGGTLASGGVASAVIVALLAHGLVDTPIFKLELAVLFWLYIAIILSLRGRKKTNLVG